MSASVWIDIPAGWDFTALFEPMECEYRSAMKRSRWALSTRKASMASVERVLALLPKALAALEEAFVQWGSAHRQEVEDAVTAVLADTAFGEGNAQKDLLRMTPQWFQSDRPIKRVGGPP